MVKQSNATALDEFYKAIGQCLMAWAMVEYQLQGSYRDCFRESIPEAEARLSKIIGFKRRVDEIKKVLRRRLEGDPALDLAVALCNRATEMSNLRNEIAHATLLHVGGQFYALEPYMFVSLPNPHIRLNEVHRRTMEFNTFADAVFWFNWTILTPPSVESDYTKTPPQLIVGMREAISREKGKPYGSGGGV